MGLCDTIVFEVPAIACCCVFDLVLHEWKRIGKQQEPPCAQEDRRKRPVAFLRGEIFLTTLSSCVRVALFASTRTRSVHRDGAAHPWFIYGRRLIFVSLNLLHAVRCHSQQNRPSANYQAELSPTHNADEDTNFDMVYGIAPVLNVLRNNRREKLGMYCQDGLAPANKKDRAAANRIYDIARETDVP